MPKLYICLGLIFVAKDAFVILLCDMRFDYWMDVSKETTRLIEVGRTQINTTRRLRRLCYCFPITTTTTKSPFLPTTTNFHFSTASISSQPPPLPIAHHDRHLSPPSPLSLSYHLHNHPKTTTISGIALAPRRHGLRWGREVGGLKP